MNRKALATSISGLALALATAAHAQTAPVATAPEAGQETTVETIIVTGSRIARRDYISSSPIATVGQDALAKSSAINIEATLNQMPQFVQGQTASSIGAVGGAGRASLNLRGLGESRNLVLLDGRRLPMSNAFGVVDVNIIPQSILEGVETISGGASAVYGSDAISGVVNFKSRRNFEGLIIDARYGNSFKSDARTTDFSITGGAATADDRGHALVSLGYSDRQVLWGNRRDFFSLGVLSSFIGQGTYVPSASNLPTQAALNTVFGGYGAAAGAVSPSRSLGFNDDGTLFSQIGATNYKGPTSGYFSTVGGTVRQPVAYQEFIVNPMTRRSAFGKFDYKVTDSIKAYAQAMYTESTVTGQVGWTPTLYAIPSIPVTNPFIPADLRTILASRPNPTAPFTLNQRFTAFDTREFIADFRVSQFLVGFTGELPWRGWTWDVYGSHDSMDLVETQDKAILLSKLNTLLAAADGGASICAGGYNPFGLAAAGSVSQACRNYVETRTHNYTKTSQDIVEASLQGKLFTLPAGDLQFSGTLGYRENSFDFQPDPSLISQDIIGTLATNPGGGATSVKEASIELLIPLLKDLPFVKALDLDVGYRTSDYNVSGRVGTYKADVTWKPVESLLLRGGYERAIRAPNIGELYSAATAAQAAIGSPPGQGDPCDVRSSARTGASAANVRTLCIATGVPGSIVDNYQYTTTSVGTLSSGSTDLTPEQADTYTAGVVWRSPFEHPLLSGLSASVDYYTIDISNVISVVSGVTAINKCYNLDGTNPTYAASNTYCQLISRDATGGVRTVATPYLNLGGLKTRGVDVQADWKVPLSAFGLDDRWGRFDLNLVANFTDSYRVQLLPGSAWQEYAGTIDGTQGAGLPLPDWKLLTTLTYSVGPAELGVRWRHLPSMKDVTSVTRPTSPAPGVGAYDMVDLTGSLKIRDGLVLRAGISNVADKDPLQIAGTFGLTQPGTYDIVGRSYFLALQARF